MDRIIIMPYKMNSISSKSLSKFFNTKRIYPDRKYKPAPNDIIINWGYGGEAPVIANGGYKRLLNRPESVAIAANKLETLKVLRSWDIDIPHFYTTNEEAEDALFIGKTLYARTILTGREGKGIMIIKPGDDIIDAKLYTEYFENDREFRVHVFDSKVIDFVEKKRMSTERAEKLGIKKSDRDHMVRNLKKGWSFCRKNIELPNNVGNLAINAINALGLDFGAVDIAYNTNYGYGVVLEINTAPGMKKGTTTHFNYVKAIGELIGEDITADDYNRRYDCDILNAEDPDIPDEDHEMIVEPIIDVVKEKSDTILEKDPGDGIAEDAEKETIFIDDMTNLHDSKLIEELKDVSFEEMVRRRRAELQTFAGSGLLAAMEGSIDLDNTDPTTTQKAEVDPKPKESAGFTWIDFNKSKVLKPDDFQWWYLDVNNENINNGKQES